MSDVIIRIERGDPTPDEVAALLVALMPAGAEPPARPAARRSPRWTPPAFLVPHSWHAYRPAPVSFRRVP